MNLNRFIRPRQHLLHAVVLAISTGRFPNSTRRIIYDVKTPGLPGRPWDPLDGFADRPHTRVSSMATREFAPLVG